MFISCHLLAEEGISDKIVTKYELYGVYLRECLF